MGRTALWVRIFLYSLFSRTRTDEHWRDAIAELGEGAPVVHVLEVRSSLDGLLLNYWLSRNGLRPVFVANGFRSWMFKPLHLILSWPILRLLGYAAPSTSDPKGFARTVAEGKPGLLFIKKNRLLFSPSSVCGTDYIEALVDLQRTSPAPLKLIPHVVIWNMGAERLRKRLLDMVFGSPSVSGLRRFFAFMQNASNVRVYHGAVQDLRDILAAQPPETSTRDLAQKIRFLLHREIGAELKVARGPMQKGAAKVCEEIQANPEFSSGLDSLAQEEHSSPAKLRRRSRRYLKEIAADMRESHIRALSTILTPVFNRLFSGIVVDMELLDTIRESSRKAPVVLVPAHRSHADYLILSYLLYNNGIVPPHIAAGANLSFFPMGQLFRRCGAFFIRRTFKGNRLYGFCLSHYIRKLIKDGHSLEFFIEGGRSRTGKVLPPRFGILSNIVDTVLSGSARDVIFIPVSMSYDRIIEAGSYTAEISGMEKQSENVAGVVKSASILDSHYGVIYISGGRPLGLDEFLKENGWQEGEPAPDHRRYLIRKLGYSLLREIEQASVVTPSAILATILLTHFRRGISWSRLCRKAGFLVRYIRDRRGVLSLNIDRVLRAKASELGLALENSADDPLGHQMDTARGKAIWPALETTMATFLQEGWVEVVETEGEKVYSVLPSRRVYLDYYRNSMLHLMLREAFLAVSILARSHTGVIGHNLLLSDMEFLSRLMRGEFIFRVGRIDDGMHAGLRALEDLHFIKAHPNGVSVDPDHLEDLQMLRNAVMPVLESYLIAARHLPVLRWRGAMPDKELVKRILEKAKREYFEGQVTCAEAVSKITLGNAVQAFTDTAILEQITTGLDSGKLKFTDTEAIEKLDSIRWRLELLLGISA